MAHVKNGFISVSGKVISDIIEIANTFAPEGFLVTVDIEKSFDSVNHCFLLQIARKLGFVINYLVELKRF